MSLKDIRKIFSKAQKSLSLHTELVLELKNCLQEASYADFKDMFFTCLKHPMVISENSPYVENSFKFVSSFLNSLNDDSADGPNDLLNSALQFLIKASDVDSHVVRFRACQLLHMILESMDNEAAIDEGIFEGIVKAMLIRQRDASSKVQIYANYALSRLQKIDDPNNAVTKAYVQHLKYNSNALVRAAVLKSLAVSRFTIETFVERSRDYNSAVRSSVHSIFADRVHIKGLTPEQCLYLIESGIYDPSKEVRDVFFHKLFTSWVNTFNGELSALLTYLDVTVSSQILKRALFIFFSNSELNVCVQNFLKFEESAFDAKQKILLPDKLTPGRVFLWLTVCNFIKYKAQPLEMEELLDRLIPSTTEFCNYLKNDILPLFRTKVLDYAVLDDVFVMSCFLKLVLVTDLSEKYGRTELTDMVSYLVVKENISFKLFDAVAQIMLVLQKKQNKLAEWAMEIISEIHEPLIQIETEENMTTAHKDDPVVIHRCLYFGCEIIKVLTSTECFPPLMHFTEVFVKPCLLSLDVHIRSTAFCCLGMICTMDKNLAMQSMMLFLNAVKRDDDIVSDVALKAIFDNIVAHDIHISESPNEENGNEALVRLLTSFLLDENETLRTTAAAGFCKLFCSEVCRCPILFSKLTLIWFNRELAPLNSMIKRTLNTFFPFYTARNVENKNCVEKSLMYSLKAILSALPGSPLYEIDPVEVVRLLTGLTATSKAFSSDEELASDHSFHGRMVLHLLREIASDEVYHRHLQKIIKIINLFDLHNCAKPCLKEIYCVNRQVCKQLNPKYTSGLKAFNAKIRKLLQERALSNSALDELIVSPNTTGNRGGSIITNETRCKNKTPLLSKSIISGAAVELPSDSQVRTMHNKSVFNSPVITGSRTREKSIRTPKISNMPATKRKSSSNDKEVYSCYVKLKRLSKADLPRKCFIQSAPPQARARKSRIYRSLNPSKAKTVFNGSKNVKNSSRLESLQKTPDTVYRNSDTHELAGTRASCKKMVSKSDSVTPASLVDTSCASYSRSKQNEWSTPESNSVNLRYSLRLRSGRNGMITPESRSANSGRALRTKSNYNEILNLESSCASQNCSMRLRSSHSKVSSPENGTVNFILHKCARSKSGRVNNADDFTHSDSFRNKVLTPKGNFNDSVTNTPLRSEQDVSDARKNNSVIPLRSTNREMSANWNKTISSVHVRYTPSRKCKENAKSSLSSLYRKSQMNKNIVVDSNTLGKATRRTEQLRTKTSASRILHSKVRVLARSSI